MSASKNIANQGAEYGWNMSLKLDGEETSSNPTQGQEATQDDKAQL